MAPGPAAGSARGLPARMAAALAASCASRAERPPSWCRRPGQGAARVAPGPHGGAGPGALPGLALCGGHAAPGGRHRATHGAGQAGGAPATCAPSPGRQLSTPRQLGPRTCHCPVREAAGLLHRWPQLCPAAQSLASQPSMAAQRSPTAPLFSVSSVDPLAKLTDALDTRIQADAFPTRPTPPWEARPGPSAGAAWVEAQTESHSSWTVQRVPGMCSSGAGPCLTWPCMQAQAPRGARCEVMDSSQTACLADQRCALQLPVERRPSDLASQPSAFPGSHSRNASMGVQPLAVSGAQPRMHACCCGCAPPGRDARCSCLCGPAHAAHLHTTPEAGLPRV